MPGCRRRPVLAKTDILHRRREIAASFPHHQFSSAVSQAGRCAANPVPTSTSRDAFFVASDSYPCVLFRLPFMKIARQPTSTRPNRPRIRPTVEGVTDGDLLCQLNTARGFHPIWSSGNDVISPDTQLYRLSFSPRSLFP